MPTAKYLGKRALLIILQVLAAAIGVFLLLRALPANPVAQIVGINPSPTAIAGAEKQLGLDQSTFSQLSTYLGQLAHGDLGTSWATNQSVNSEIVDKLAVTLQFVVPAFVIAVLVGVPIGIFVATRPGGKLDRGVTGYSLFAGAQPDFWWGLMFLFLFNFVFHIFPAPLGLLDPVQEPPPTVTHFILIDSLIAGQPDIFWSAFMHLALPTLTLAFVLSGPIIRMTRQSTGVAFESDYVLYAQASGIPESQVRRRTLAVSIAPVLTLIGILFGFMLGGAVLIETVFSLDGIGRYALQSTLALDFPAIQGSVIVLTLIALIVYVAMDLLHALVDRRVALR